MRKYARIRETARNLIPDLPVIRKYLSSRLEKSVRSTLIPKEDVILGENGTKNKLKILKKYHDSLGSHIKHIEPGIDTAIKTGINYKNLEKSELDAIKIDMRFCNIAYGFIPNEYVALGLEKKGYDERITYVSDQQRRIFRCRMNDILAGKLFVNKGQTFEMFREYYQREVISISTPMHFKRFHDFVKRHDKFVLKNAIDSLGNGVKLVKRKEIKNEKEFFLSCIKKGTHVLEELIVQSDELAAFNRSSVNTVRAISFNTPKGITVPYCILRMGREGSFIDNGGNGGVIACIDYETGEIITDGYDEKGNAFQSHPDSGTVFKGFKMPDWEALRTLCKTVALKTPKIRMVGWDFAHTPNGWVIVEGNDSPHLIGQQMILGGLKETMDTLLKEMENESSN